MVAIFHDQPDLFMSMRCTMIMDFIFEKLELGVYQFIGMWVFKLINMVIIVQITVQINQAVVHCLSQHYSFSEFDFKPKSVVEIGKKLGILRTE